MADGIRTVVYFGSAGLGPPAPLRRAEEAGIVRVRYLEPAAEVIETIDADDLVVMDEEIWRDHAARGTDLLATFGIEPTAQPTVLVVDHHPTAQRLFETIFGGFVAAYSSPIGVDQLIRRWLDSRRRPMATGLDYVRLHIIDAIDATSVEVPLADTDSILAKVHDVVVQTQPEIGIPLDHEVDVAEIIAQVDGQLARGVIGGGKIWRPRTATQVVLDHADARRNSFGIVDGPDLVELDPDSNGFIEIGGPDTDVDGKLLGDAEAGDRAARVADDTGDDGDQADSGIWWNSQFPMRPDLTAAEPADRGPVRRGWRGTLRTELTAVGPAGESRPLDPKDLDRRRVVLAVRSDTVDLAVSSATDEHQQAAMRIESDPIMFDLSALPLRLDVVCTFRKSGPASLQLSLAIDGTPFAFQTVDVSVADDAHSEESLGPKEGRDHGRKPAPRPPSTEIPAEALGAVEAATVSLTMDGDGMEGVFHGSEKRVAPLPDKDVLEPVWAVQRNILDGIKHPSGVIDFDLGTATDDILLKFARAGAEFHGKVFGPIGVTPGTGDLARALASCGSRDAPAVLSLEDAYDLPVPWGLLYDGVALEAVERVHGAARDAARARAPMTAAEVDLERFWGVRFDIRHVVRRAGPIPSTKVGPHLTAAINVGFDPKIVEEQRKRLTTAATPTAPPARIAVDAVLEDPDALTAWVREAEPCDLLYLFCHAMAPQQFGAGGAPGVARSPDDGSLGFAKVEDGSSQDVELSLGTLRDEWNEARQRAPVVLLHACGGGAIDGRYGAPFAKYFLANWEARSLLAASWKVPTEFGDVYSRAILDFLDEGRTLGQAMRAVAERAFAKRNPYPLIYAVYGIANVAISKERT